MPVLYYILCRGDHEADDLRTASDLCVSSIVAILLIQVMKSRSVLHRSCALVPELYVRREIRAVITFYISCFAFPLNGSFIQYIITVGEWQQRRFSLAVETVSPHEDGIIFSTFYISVNSSGPADNGK